MLSECHAIVRGGQAPTPNIEIVDLVVAVGLGLFVNAVRLHEYFVSLDAVSHPRTRRSFLATPQATRVV